MHSKYIFRHLFIHFSSLFVVLINEKFCKFFLVVFSVLLIKAVFLTSGKRNFSLSSPQDKLVILKKEKFLKVVKQQQNYIINEKHFYEISFHTHTFYILHHFHPNNNILISFHIRSLHNFENLPLLVPGM